MDNNGVDLGVAGVVASAPGQTHGLCGFIVGAGPMATLGGWKTLGAARVGWILAIGGSALVSCSQSPSDAGPPVGAVTCPSGVALTNTQAASLPVVDWKGGTLPRCEPRCGVGTPEMGFPPASAIPTGVCVKDAATCGIGARLACKDGLGGGPVNGYACSCVDGRWSCVIIQQGGAICSGGLFAD